MSSDEDEDFPGDGPTLKKVKKSSGGEGKGRKKKEPKASNKKAVSSSPKRKTPNQKKGSEKEDKKKDKKEKPAGRGKTLQPDFEKASSVRSKSKKDASEQEDNDSDEDPHEEESKSNQPEDEEEVPEDNESEAEEDSQPKEAAKKDNKPKEKRKGGKVEGYDEILEYMSKQNRPYSLINIFDNLHGKIKKGTCQKALDLLVSDGELKGKEFGKAIVYLLNQNNIPSVDEKDMEKLKSQVNKKKKEVEDLQGEVKELNTTLKEVTAQLTSEEIEKEIAKYTQLNKEIDTKLKVYESGNYPKISDEEILAAENKKKGFENEYKKRKRICKSLVDHIADMTEQKISEIIVKFITSN